MSFTALLANGATSFMYEGAPNFPDFDRFWDIIERHKINIFYTAPTAIRAFIKWGEEYPHKHDLSSLRLLGTVGEPINPEAWMWYHKIIGKEKCPIVDTWWQTETGGIMISPFPGATPTVPGTATRPFPGISIDIRNKEGESVGDKRRRLSRYYKTVSFDAADDLERRRTLSKNNIGRKSRTSISRATAHGAINADITG